MYTYIDETIKIYNELKNILSNNVKCFTILNGTRKDRNKYKNSFYIIIHDHLYHCSLCVKTIIQSIFF